MQGAITMTGVRVACWIVTVAALIGMILSTVSLQAHYRTDKSEFCDLNETFNCDLVNRSEYSHIGPVPVAGIGLAGYIFLLLLSRMQPQRKRVWILFASAVAGLGFALYLTYIEAYVLATWCLLCLGSLAMISNIAVTSGVLAFRRSPQTSLVAET